MAFARLQALGFCHLRQRQPCSSQAWQRTSFVASRHWVLGSPSSLEARCFASRALKPVKRDPERPVKPETPWISFMRDFREQQKGSSLKSAEMMKAAAVQWKAMPEPDKTKYEAPYAAAKQRYDAEMKTYVESGKKDAWERDPARPKAPLTPYLCYAQEFRQTAPSLKMTEVSKLAAESWKDLDAPSKQRFEKQYAADKEQYAKDLKAYQDSGKEAAWKEKVGLAEKEAKEAEKKKKEAEKKEKAKLAEKAKKEKEKAKKEKEKEIEKKKLEKEKAKKEKEKEIEKKKLEKEKEKKKLAAEKEQAKKEKEKAKAKAANEKSAAKAKAKA